MKQSILSKAAVAGSLVLASLGMAQAAHARTDVVFSVGVPAPMYAPQRYAYEVEAQPAYVAPRVYAQPAYAYGQPDYWSERQREREWRHEQWRREQMRRWYYRHHREWSERGWD